ncbi:cytochrome b5-like heme/steroid binding domain-containing protein [Suillus ampliporus]|nr:cytochrome b5-like heme/steroid binding domain-containing protein [Suillus ampliporus]
MSWILNPDGDTPKPPAEDNLVQDPSDPTRMVTKKAANQPFLAYVQYREKQEQEHQAWLERKREREEKLAKGEEVGPEEEDPTAEHEVGFLGLMKFIVYLILFVVVAGKFFTGSFLWEYDGKWARLKTYWPNSGRLFSETYLATFDGSDPTKPLYLAVDGDVFDVSSNARTYGPGGPYHHMVGVDAARSFGTGCFATHRTHDLRGLSENELRGVQHWKKFFAEHKTYNKVGRVLHHPIDPESPIPKHCDPKKEQTSHPTTGDADPSSHSKAKSIREEL